MLDLIVLAFWTDSTRISTFMFANDVSGRNFGPLIEGTERRPPRVFAPHRQGRKDRSLQKDQPLALGPVGLPARSHAFDPRRERHPAGQLDDPVRLEHFRRRSAQSRAICRSSWPAAAATPLPTGRHIASPNETPLCNLYASMLDRMGTPVEQLRRQQRQTARLQHWPAPPDVPILAGSDLRR